MALAQNARLRVDNKDPGQTGTGQRIQGTSSSSRDRDQLPCLGTADSLGNIRQRGWKAGAVGENNPVPLDPVWKEAGGLLGSSLV
jgi:hypothetical protein